MRKLRSVGGMGTTLVHDLIKSEHTITITESTSAEGNETVPTNKDASKKPDVGSGSTISFNPNDKGDRILNEDGTTGRPAQVGLAHELIHAEKNKDWKHNISIMPKFIDPDNANLPKPYSEISREEVKVQQKDSWIGKEQGAKPRLQPFAPIPPKVNPIDYKIDLKIKFP